MTQRMLFAAGVTVLLISWTLVPPPAAAAEPAGQPAKIKVNAYIQSISKFDVPLDKYNVDMTIEFTGPEGAKLEDQDFDILNGDIEKDGKKALESDEPNVRKYAVKAEIDLDLDFHRYPFDEQDLSISIYDPDRTTKELVFETDEVVDRESKVKIPGFSLSEPEAATVSEDSFDEPAEKYSIYTIPLSITRPTLSAFMKTFAPLIVMLLISMLALAMGPSASPGRLATVSGTLLGAVMFHLSTTSSLPPIGYVTLTDKLFIATYLSFLTNVAFTVWMMRKNDLKQEAAAQAVYSRARLVVPAATLLFYLVAFFI